MGNGSHISERGGQSGGGGLDTGDGGGDLGCEGDGVGLNNKMRHGAFSYAEADGGHSGGDRVWTDTVCTTRAA